MKRLMIAVVLLLLIVWTSIGTKQPLTYQMVILGDSIVANYNGDDGITALLGKGLGKTIFNGAFGGSTIAEFNEDRYETNGFQSLSLSQLADSIVAKDFTTQISTINYLKTLDFNEARVRELALVDFEQVEYLILEGMVNDFALQTDPHKVEEALTDAITKIQKKYPRLKIVISTPVYCYIYDVEQGKSKYCDDPEDWTYLLKEYIEIQYAIAEKFDVLLVDQYTDSVITKDTLEKYTDDGLHLSAAGRKVVSQNIINSIQQEAVFKEE